MVELNDNTIQLYALNSYRTHSYIISEFLKDLKRIVNIKKLIRKYKMTKILKDRIILNNIILFYNCFEIEAATRMLFYKMDVVDYPQLKTILLFLNYMPDVVVGINGNDVINLDIPIDISLVKILREI